ncbi:MAG TPA: hypothetical protein VFA99_15825 [Acidobacteriaceae bacterium]|nr:hypothetical protein [Acidobacteriaceae bacterium]
MAMLLLAGTALLPAQSASCGITRLPESGTKFYPPIAQAARVSGTVVLLASFDHNGNAKVSRMLQGPPMLQPAAVRLIEASKSGASTGSRECPIVISFELMNPDSCDIPPEPHQPVSSKDPQHFVVLGRVVPICDPMATVTKRKKHLIFF